jgi:hypothetical protein
VFCGGLVFFWEAHEFGLFWGGFGFRSYFR